MTEKEEILDPECDSEHWWELAADYPLEAMASVLFPLLTLEAPARWEKMQEEYAEQWIEISFRRLPWEQKELFAMDCAERALPIFEQKHPNDMRPRDAIKARRLFAQGRISREIWLNAQKDAQQAVFAVNALNVSIYSSEKSAALAAAAANAANVYFYAAESIFHATKSNKKTIIEATFSRDAERAWRWNRLLQYVRGEVE